MSTSGTTRAARQAVRIVLTGHVQGLGVRPAIARLAAACQIHGSVRNTSDGVVIDAEAAPELLTRFQSGLSAALPVAAQVEQVSVQPRAVSDVAEFRIDVATDAGPVTVPVPLDLAICQDCLREIQEPANRRYRYPFTSCTNCGPRYTIIEAMPYERPQTSLSRFAMCADCRQEFVNPHDRRFHAQTIACPNCGPSIWFKDSRGSTFTTDETALQAAAQAIQAGQIVALRGLGGYQLLVDATHEAAVQRLRGRKRRPSKPFAVLVESLKSAESLAWIDDLARASLSSPANPIHLLTAKPGNGIAAAVHPRLQTIGVMLSTTALHALLLQAVARPLVCTSGNLEGEPLEYEIEAAEARLVEVCDAWLHHNLPIAHPTDDSVVRTIGGCNVTIRAARGLAPLVLPVPVPTPSLALGAHQKAALAWSTGQTAILGPHLGEQTTLHAQERYQATLKNLSPLYRFRPQLISHDQHPQYYSTQVAEKLASQSGLQRNSVQHHHAHIVAVMAEQGWLAEEVLGVAWDGTGYGSDQTIWGGEFLRCTAARSERLAALRPFRLPGGEVAVREPWRVAVSLLEQCRPLLEESCIQAYYAELADHPEIGESRLQQVRKLVEHPKFSPVTTSAGRLFDALASLLLQVHFSDFEGYPAMLLEEAAEQKLTPLRDSTSVTDLSLGTLSEFMNSEQASHTADLCWKESSNQLDWGPLISVLCRRRMDGSDPADAALLVHQTLAASIVQFSRRFPGMKLALGGGVFQNRVLVEMIEAQLACAAVDEHHAGRLAKDSTAAAIDGCLGRSRQIPPNDGGIAIGQLIVAARQQQLQAVNSAGE